MSSEPWSGSADGARKRLSGGKPGGNAFPYSVGAAPIAQSDG